MCHFSSVTVDRPWKACETKCDMSFRKIENSNGGRFSPCLTPTLHVKKSERSSFVVTQDLTWLYKLRITLNDEVLTLRDYREQYCTCSWLSPAPATYRFTNSCFLPDFFAFLFPSSVFNSLSVHSPYLVVIVAATVTMNTKCYCPLLYTHRVNLQPAVWPDGLRWWCCRPTSNRKTRVTSCP